MSSSSYQSLGACLLWHVTFHTFVESLHTYTRIIPNIYELLYIHKYIFMFIIHWKICNNFLYVYFPLNRTAAALAPTINHSSTSSFGLDLSWQNIFTNITWTEEEVSEQIYYIWVFVSIYKMRALVQWTRTVFYVFLFSFTVQRLGSSKIYYDLFYSNL